MTKPTLPDTAVGVAALIGACSAGFVVIFASLLGTIKKEEKEKGK